MLKRNQVEEAIINVWDPLPKKHAAHLRNQIKRLLETDRSLGRIGRSSDPERADHAFYSHRMPGKGRDNRFSNYDAFALLTGLRLMRHGWPQRFAVALMRQVRPALEREYARVFAQDPAVLFDKRLIKEQAKPGSLVVDNSDPIFLGILTTHARDGDLPKAAVCRGQLALMTFLAAQGGGQTLTSLEVASSVHILANALSQVSVRSRGRSCS